MYFLEKWSNEMKGNLNPFLKPFDNLAEKWVWTLKIIASEKSNYSYQLDLSANLNSSSANKSWLKM